MKKRSISEYKSDVEYGIYIRGGDVDRIDYERVHDAYYDGIEAERMAQNYLRQERYERERLQNMRDEEEYMMRVEYERQQRERYYDNPINDNDLPF